MTCRDASGQTGEHPPGGADQRNQPDAHDGQRYNVVTTTEGEVGVVVPISGEDYMVLLSLQKYIVDSLPQIAALNPDNYR